MDVAITPYNCGQEVRVEFVGANPRNNLRLEGTYAAVEKRASNTWKVVRDDTDWNLVYQWERTAVTAGQSKVTISWTIEHGTAPGHYRIKYYGDSKALLTGKITAFEGISASFSVA